jgi:hypothetical protein
LHADYRYIADLPEAEVAGVADDARRRDVRDLRVRDLLEIAEIVREGAQATAEDDADAGRDANARAYGLRRLVDQGCDVWTLAHRGTNAITHTRRNARAQHILPRCAIEEGCDRPGLVGADGWY